MGFWSRGHKFTHESEVSLTGQPSVFHSCISGSPDIFLVGNSVSCNTVGNNVLHGMGNDGDDEPSICLSFLGVTAHVTVKIVHLFHLRLHPQVQSYNPSERLIIYDQFAFPETRGGQTSLQPYLLCILGWFRFHFPRTNAESKALSATPLAIYLGMHSPVICLGVENKASLPALMEEYSGKTYVGMYAYTYIFRCIFGNNSQNIAINVSS